MQHLSLRERHERHVDGLLGEQRASEVLSREHARVDELAREVEHALLRVLRVKHAHVVERLQVVGLDFRRVEIYRLQFLVKNNGVHAKLVVLREVDLLWLGGIRVLGSLKNLPFLL